MNGKENCLQHNAEGQPEIILNALHLHANGMTVCIMTIVIDVTVYRQLDISVRSIIFTPISVFKLSDMT